MELVGEDTRDTTATSMRVITFPSVEPTGICFTSLIEETLLLVRTETIFVPSNKYPDGTEKLLSPRTLEISAIETSNRANASGSKATKRSNI